MSIYNYKKALEAEKIVKVKHNHPLKQGMCKRKSIGSHQEIDCGIGKLFTSTVYEYSKGENGLLPVIDAFTQGSSVVSTVVFTESHFSHFSAVTCSIVEFAKTFDEVEIGSLFYDLCGTYKNSPPNLKTASKIIFIVESFHSQFSFINDSSCLIKFE